MDKKLLKSLIGLPSPSGYEFMTHQWIGEYLRDLGFRAPEIDKFGNQYIWCCPSQDPGIPTVMVSAHIDEIGLVLRRETPEGLWEFRRIGGIDQKVLEGQRVRCYPDPTGSPDVWIPGVIGKKPIHLEDQADRKSTDDPDTLVIDFGDPLIKPGIGAPVVYEKTVTELGKSLISAPGLDDKAGVWVVLRVLSDLKDLGLPINLVGVLMVQEETGLRGAKVASGRVNPDVSLDIDVSFASDEGRSYKGLAAGQVKLGSGPLLQYGPSCDYRTIRELDQSEIPHQIGVTGAGGTNTSAIQEWSENALTALISIPLRNMHTPVEVIDFRDLQGTAKIIEEWILKKYSRA